VIRFPNSQERRDSQFAGYFDHKTKEKRSESMQIEDVSPAECKKSILIAEDDPDDRVLLTEMLSSMSEVEASFVGDGRELIDYLLSHQEHPSLILIDLNMPRMSGREALVQIQAERLTNAPIVCMATAIGTGSDYRFCVAHGAKTFLAKASTYDEYSDALHSIIKEWAVACDCQESQLGCFSALGTGNTIPAN
jgi:CheY-like chemotaxis protein